MTEVWIASRHAERLAELLQALGGTTLIHPRNAHGIWLDLRESGGSATD